MWRTDSCIRSFSSVSLAVLCACVLQCVVPVRVPTKSKSASGQTGKKLDLEFIKPGSTTREEIDQKLGWIDAGLKDDKIFLGRWADSSWGIAWAIGGGYTGAAGWNRTWSIHNLVLYLNEEGIVQQRLIIPDTEILSTLSILVLRDSARSLDLSVPIKLPVDYIRSTKRIAGTLVLSKDEFMFLGHGGTGSKVACDFRTPPQNIRHVGMGKRAASDSNNPQNVGVKIHFKQPVSVGKEMTVQMKLPATMTLLIYTQQTQSNSSSK